MGDPAESMAHEATPLAEPGVVRVRVIDEATGLAAELVALRLLHPERCVDEDDLPGEVALRLTPGGWSGQIAMPERELADIAPFEVVAGGELVLPPVVVRCGSGVIEGRVVALHLDPAAPLVVELQRSSARRAGPPRRVEVGADHRFRFGELEAGDYRLSAGAPDTPLLDLECVELAVEECVHVDLAVGAPASLELELRDPEGRLLRVGPSTASASEPEDVLVFEIRSSRGVERRCACRLRRDADAGTTFWHVSGFSSSTTSDTPTYAARSVPGVFLYVCDSDDTGIAIARRVDRARTPSDGLFPTWTLPDPLGAALHLQVERFDRVRLEPLPPEIVTLVVRYGRLATEARLKDLSSGACGPSDPRQR